MVYMHPCIAALNKCFVWLFVVEDCVLSLNYCMKLNTKSKNKKKFVQGVD